MRMDRQPVDDDKYIRGKAGKRNGGDLGRGVHWGQRGLALPLSVHGNLHKSLPSKEASSPHPESEANIGALLGRVRSNCAKSSVHLAQHLAQSKCPWICSRKSCAGEGGLGSQGPSQVEAGWLSLSTAPSVCPAAPPERIVHPAARSLDLQFGTPGRVELRCEVAPAGSQVRWYKDGLEVEASATLQLGAEGPARTLTLPCAQPEDAGEYVCETRDEAVTFNVSLAGGCFLPAWVRDGVVSLSPHAPLSVQSPQSSSSPQRQPLPPSAWPPGSWWC